MKYRVLHCLPLLIAAFFALSACKKDPCKDTTCQNGGSCVDGNCVCPLGWEGGRCEVDMRDKFAGVWRGSLACDAPPTDTQIEIRKLAGEPGRLLIAGVWSAQITGSSAFEVPLQQMRDPSTGAILLVNGRGELQGNTLTLRMLYSNPAGGGFSCTFTLTRS